MEKSFLSQRMFKTELRPVSQSVAFVSFRNILYDVIRFLLIFIHFESLEPSSDSMSVVCAWHLRKLVAGLRV